MVVDIGADLRAALKDSLKIADDEVERISTYYEQRWHECPGAPPPGELTEEDIPAIGAFPRFFENPPPDDDDLATWDWDHFREIELAEFRRDALQSDPYMPSWYMKTDEANRQTPWVDSWGSISEVGRSKLDFVCAVNRPNENLSLRDRLSVRPTSSDLALADTVEALIKLEKYMLRPLGLYGDGDNAVWRWGPTLCLASSFGMTVLRYLAAEWGKTWEDWQHWATCPEQELMHDLIEAHKASAYPLGFLRVEWWRLRHALADEQLAGNGGVNQIPYAYQLRQLVHILQHTRIVVNRLTGERALRMVYRGNFAVVPIESMELPLGAIKHKQLAAEMCRVLQMPSSGNPNRREWDEECTAKLFAKLLPQYFPRAQTVRQRRELIFADNVTIKLGYDDPDVYRWTDPGLRLMNIAAIDLNTGRVDKDVTLDDADVAGLDWQSGLVEPSAIMNWRANIPDVVKPALPTEILEPYFKHLDWLGFPEGGRAMLNSVILLGLFRDDLAGTTIGRALSQEFPLIAVMPTGSTKEETTNQGKTNLGRILMRVFAPGIVEQKMELSNSAPAQRSMALAFYRHGTALFDEFIQPTSPDHFLSPAGLQSLCTGGSVAPGKAGENAEPISLKFPMCIVQKVSSATPDILNRMLPLFLGNITPETTLTPEAMLKVMTPEMGMQVRLSMLLWAHQNDFVETVKKLELMVGKWRFSAHMAVACLFGSPEAVNAYIDAAAEQCEKQREEAQESGLTTDLGIKETFNPKFYFDNASEYTLGVLQAMSEGPDCLVSPLEGLRVLVEDDHKRNFSRVLSEYRVKEQSAQMQFISQLRKGPMARGDWRLAWIPRDKSDRRDSSGRVRAFLVVTNVGDKKAQPEDAELPSEQLATLAPPPPPPPPATKGPPPPPGA